MGGGRHEGPDKQTLKLCGRVTVQISALLGCLLLERKKDMPDFTIEYRWACGYYHDYMITPTSARKYMDKPTCTWTEEYGEERYEDDGKCPRCGGHVCSYPVAT